MYSEVVSQILDTLPPDPTDAEDMILSSLFSGKPADALSQAAKHDLWLSAHWSDLMETLDLIDSAVDPGYVLLLRLPAQCADCTPRTELTTRQQFVLSYAESLRSDPVLWRITVAYMGACGEAGLRRADEVLLRVPIMDEDKKATINIDSDEDAVPETLQEVVKMCYELGREHVRRDVCSVSDSDWSSCVFLAEWSSDCRAKVHATQTIRDGSLVSHLGGELDRPWPSC